MLPFISRYLICLAIVYLLGTTQPVLSQTPSRTTSPNHIETVKKGLPAAVQATPTPTVEARTPVPWMDYLKKTGLATGIIMVASLLIHFTGLSLIWFSESTRILQKTTPRTVLILKIVIWTLLLYLILEIVVSPPPETVIILLSAAGLAISLAFQDLLKNMLNGMALLFDPPFRVGDKIRIGTTYGEVLTIGLRYTRIVSPDDTIINLPNRDISLHALTHMKTDSTHSTVCVEMFLPPDTDMVEVKTIARRAAEVSRYIYLHKPIQIFFSNELQQGRPVLKLLVKSAVLHIRYELLFRSEVTEVIFHELLRRGLIKADTGTTPSKI